MDGDTHGAASGPKSVCGTKAPAGYVTSNDDCCDVGSDAANIFPGQTKWFTSMAASCGKGWDYNCDNNIELEITQLADACVPNPGGYCPVGPQWQATSIPACGVSGSTNNCFQPAGTPPGTQYCITNPPGPQTQGCH
jgi:hypothetical protein